MTILFVCGSLAVGKDGVGDYTRRLAANILCKGHQVRIIASNDKEVSAVVAETQNEGHTQISVLRLPHNNVFNERCSEIERMIETFNPEWISLQYVPFSFDDKGLPFSFAKGLRKVSKGRKWHIMFHELWVGLESGGSKKFFFWGKMQQWMMTKMIQTLKPLVIHTNTDVYKSALLDKGVESDVLPLFGNIPVSTVRNNELSTVGQSISIVIFGSIHESTLVNSFAEEVAALQKELGVTFQLVLVGRNGNGKAAWVKAWVGQGLQLKDFEQQSPEVVSRVLSEAAFGVTTTPYALVDKSGTVAAMREHGLPIICVARNWKPKIKVKGYEPKNIYEYNFGSLKDFYFNINKAEFIPPINITDQFLKSLVDCI